MKRIKLLHTVLISCILLICISTRIYGDMGPKDKLTVYVENPPKEAYYLDLLTENSRSYNNFYQNGEREALDKEMVELLYSYKKEGWMPALTEGTGVPMWGSLIGKADGNRSVHTFGYVGVPDIYRIIIVTKSGNVTVSGIYSRKALQSSISFDYATGKAVVPPIFFLYILQFGWTFSITLLIEGIILLLFGFKLKSNWKVFVSINFITQVFLTATVGIALIKSGTFLAHFIQFPVELAILIIEVLVYKRFLVGNSNKRKITYGIVANLISWIGAFFLINDLFQFLLKMA